MPRADAHSWFETASSAGASKAGSFRATAVGLLVVNAVLLVGFTAVHQASQGSLFGVIANLTMVVPIVACFAHAVVGGPRRAAAIWLGLAMLSQTAGNVIYSTWTQYQTHPAVPGPADFAYWGFYVSVTAAIVCLVRRDHGSFPRALWLDGALGAAGAARAVARCGCGSPAGSRSSARPTSSTRCA